MEILTKRILLTKQIAMIDYAHPGITKGYKMLPGNIGYIFPAELKDNDLDSVKLLLSGTRGIVIDMRCYPATFMPFTYGKWFKPKPTTFAKFTVGNMNMPGDFELEGAEINGTENNKYYKGKLVIIVNGQTMSQAEYTTMALSTVPGSVVIGTQTAGADGNVSDIILPGNIKTRFSGIGILYPDGGETQRTGVKIDKIVKPTIKGIREGRDEQLEEAVSIIGK
jgi:hypothetical protein